MTWTRRVTLTPMTYVPGPPQQSWPPAPPAPPAPVKKGPGKTAKTAAAIVVALVVVFCGIGVIIAATSSSPSTPTPAATTPPAQTGAAGIVAWRDSGGLALITAMSGDFDTIGTAGKNTDVGAMNTACTKLQTDVEAAQAYKPIPDDEAQQHWAKALAFEARAATDCVAGTSRVDAGLITQSSQEMNQGAAELGLVAARMKALAG